MAPTTKSSSKKPSSSSPTKPKSSSSTSSHSHQHHPPSSSSSSSNTAAGEYLLERLRILLSRLQTTTEILQNWPEAQGDSSKIHADTCHQLIASIRKIVLGLKSVEKHVNGTPGGERTSDGSKEMGVVSKEALEAFRTSLDDKCPIPLDLLDLLDVGQPFGLNPQCYARGLMKESMRQLAGLERRKRALAMLAQSIELGMDARIITNNGGIVSDESVDDRIIQKGGEDGNDIKGKSEEPKIVPPGGVKRLIENIESSSKRKRGYGLEEAEKDGGEEVETVKKIKRGYGLEEVDKEEVETVKKIQRTDTRGYA